MEQKYWKILFYASIIAFLLSLGFFVGRKTIDIDSPKTEIVYKEGKPIHDTIKLLYPVDVVRPIDTASVIKQCVKDGIYSELFPEKTVTEYIEITKEDTSAILLDWATKRLYSETLFDYDTIGKCIINATIQYNRMSFLSYTYTPTHKETTITTNKIKYFSPFIGFGAIVDFSDKYNGLIPSVNAGFFVREKYGFNLQYGRYINNKENLFGLSLYYKF